MKLLTIIYDRGIASEIDNILKRLNISGYTKISDAQGFGDSGYKMESSIWPGANNVVFMAIEEDKIPTLVQEIRKYQDTFRQKPGITILSQSVDVL